MRSVPTRSDVASELRGARARLIADRDVGGPAFGEAFAALLDRSLRVLFDAAPRSDRTALLGLGSYARAELCPGSDVDLLLLHGGDGDVAATADALWYPLWDAGLVVGHATRTVREAQAVANDDLDSITAMLDVRLVAGDAGLADELAVRVRRLAQKRRTHLVEALARASEERRDRMISDLLEPNLKEGGGGLRDVQALAWAGWTLPGAGGSGDGSGGSGASGGGPGGSGGLLALRDAGYLQPEDPEALRRARSLLLDARVALHRVTGGKSDALPLQEQDAVAGRLGRDADTLMRELAAAARTVSWIASGAFAGLQSTGRGPLGRLARRDRPVGEGVVLRDATVTLASDAPLDGDTALRVAVAAAELDAPIDRRALARLAESAQAPGWEPRWGDGARDDLLRLLRQGRRTIPVVESLDHTGLWGALVPEWAHVRSLPQRNAYHRFTVDRHLLEAVAECSELLDGGAADPVDAAVVEGLDRPELLGLVALLHDIGKGLAGDHSEVGAEIAESLCERIGLDDEATRRIGRVVRHHLLLADVATRRDLSEEATAAAVARRVGDAPTLELLYLLTVGDSRATGPAAWGSVKAALVRELFVKTHHVLERGASAVAAPEIRRAELAERIGAPAADEFLDAMPPAYAAAFGADTMVRHRELLDGAGVAVEWGVDGADRPTCTIVAPDRPGLLASVAGVVAAHGLNVRQASVHTRSDGRALEVIAVNDPYGRLTRHGGPDRVTRQLLDVVADPGGEAGARGVLDRLAEQIDERARRYAPTRRRTKPPTPPQVVVDQEVSDFATVVEVHADDRVGLLFQVTRVLSEAGLDVHLAKVSTVGDRVIDAFYVRDATGGKIDDPERLDTVRHTLLGRLQRG